jgi:hypothetical protein
MRHEPRFHPYRLAVLEIDRRKMLMMTDLLVDRVCVR